MISKTTHIDMHTNQIHWVTIKVSWFPFDNMEHTFLTVQYPTSSCNKQNSAYRDQFNQNSTVFVVHVVSADYNGNLKQNYVPYK